LKPLYADASKAALLGQLFERFLASLRADGTLPPVQAADSGSSSSEQGQPAPQALVWVLLYLAQHHDRLGNREQALALIDECIQVGPPCSGKRSC
jgi:hypothetical protein